MLLISRVCIACAEQVQSGDSGKRTYLVKYSARVLEKNFSITSSEARAEFLKYPTQSCVMGVLHHPSKTRHTRRRIIRALAGKKETRPWKLDACVPQRFQTLRARGQEMALWWT